MLDGVPSTRRAEYLNGNFDRCSEIVAATLEHARTDLEKAEVHFTRIAQHTLLTQFPEALDAGRKALALVGVELPFDDAGQAGQEARARWRACSKGRTRRLSSTAPTWRARRWRSPSAACGTW